MTELYRDLMDIIDFQPDEEEKQRAEKYCKSLRVICGILIPAIIITGVFAIYCIYAEIQWGFYAFIVFSVLSVTLFKLYQRKYAIRVNQLINNNCNVSKALTAYMVMAQYSRKVKQSGALLTCIASTLCYGGRFAECKKVLDLISKYCDTAEGRSYRVSLSAMVSLYEKDKEAVKCCVNELKTLMSQANTPYMTQAYKVISNYPLILEAEENGEYSNALELLKINNETEPMLKKVNVNYRLYKVAKVAGMEAEASKHRTFVLEHGGDTFYKKELENIK